MVSSYASALACLVEDEKKLGATCIDMGGGTTSIAVFFDGELLHIDSLPIGERRPLTPIATWRASDEVKHAAVLAQQYAECNYDPEVLINLLAKIACRDSFTEMHAYKHNQATYEEFHATRPELRWKHLVSAVQASAISHGRLQQVYDDAAEVIHF